MHKSKLVHVLTSVPLLLLSSCAVLHHVQVGDVTSKLSHKRVTPFVVAVSEVGVDVEAGLKTMSSFNSSKNKRSGGGNSNALSEIWALSNMGPKTGIPVFTDKYAKDIIHKIYQQCPSGLITGLTSVRETRSYYYISGEIVKITGFCINEK